MIISSYYIEAIDVIVLYIFEWKYFWYSDRTVGRGVAFISLTAVDSSNDQRKVK